MTQAWFILKLGSALAEAKRRSGKSTGRFCGRVREGSGHQVSRAKTYVEPKRKRSQTSCDFWDQP